MPVHIIKRVIEFVTVIYALVFSQNDIMLLKSPRNITVQSSSIYRSANSITYKCKLQEIKHPA